MTTLEFGPFRLDRARRELRRGNEVLPLTPRVFDTLLALVERRGRVADKRELMASVWPDRVVEEANISQNVFTLRKMLGGQGGRSYIATIPGRGYRFVGVVREVEAREEKSTSAVLGVPAARAYLRQRRWALSAGALAIAALAVLLHRRR